MAYSFRACSFRCPGSYPTAWQGRYKSASAVTAASKEILVQVRVCRVSCYLVIMAYVYMRMRIQICIYHR